MKLWFYIPHSEGALGFNRSGGVKFFPTDCPLNATWVIRRCAMEAGQ